MLVQIVGLTYDYWYELAKADERLEDGEQPQPAGVDGLLYYASFKGIDSSGYPTVSEAQRAAERRAPTTIHWLSTTESSQIA